MYNMVDSEKVNISINKDIFNHPHFNVLLLKVISQFESQKEIKCNLCPHSAFEHCIGLRNDSYCRICNNLQMVNYPCKDVIRNSGFKNLKIKIK